MKTLSAFTPAYIPPSGEQVPFINFSLGNGGRYVHITLRGKTGDSVSVGFTKEDVVTVLREALDGIEAAV